MAHFDVFSLLEFPIRKSRSHSLKQKGNYKQKIHTVKRTTISLKDLSKELKGNGQHSILERFVERTKGKWSTLNTPIFKFSTKFNIKCSRY